MLSGAEMLISAVAEVRVGVRAAYLLLHTIRVLIAIRVIRRSRRASQQLALSWSAPAPLHVFAFVHLAPWSHRTTA